jgi:hypothetical protein
VLKGLDSDLGQVRLVVEGEDCRADVGTQMTTSRSSTSINQIKFALNMSRPRGYPIIACGYKVDLPYLLEFLNMGCDEDMIDSYAAIKLDWWYTDDLPRDQRETDSYPEPGMSLLLTPLLLSLQSFPSARS